MIDSVSLAVIRGRLEQIVDEMDATTGNTIAPDGAVTRTAA